MYSALCRDKTKNYLLDHFRYLGYLLTLVLLCPHMLKWDEHIVEKFGLKNISIFTTLLLSMLVKHEFVKVEFIPTISERKKCILLFKCKA